MRVITAVSDDARAAEDGVPATLARCPECGFLFDPTQYAADWPCCGPRCADAAKARLRD